MDELAKLHGILGSNTIADWVKKYGNLGNQNSIKMKKSPSPIEEKEQRKKRFKLDVRLYYHYYFRISAINYRNIYAPIILRSYYCSQTGFYPFLLR